MQKRFSASPPDIPRHKAHDRNTPAECAICRCLSRKPAMPTVELLHDSRFHEKLLDEVTTVPSKLASGLV